MGGEQPKWHLYPSCSAKYSTMEAPRRAISNL